MKAKGCLIAVAVALGVFMIFLALAGPALLREGERIYRPIAEIDGAQRDFEAWSQEHVFKPPPEVAVTAEQLDRFLDLRRRFAEVDEANPLPIEGMQQKQRPSLAEIQGLLEGVGGAVSGRMDAYREAGMPPDEYEYLDRTIYRLWLRPLRRQGRDPAAVTKASREILDLASAETERRIAIRLENLARTMSERRIPAPEGIPAELHALLLTRALEIDALIDVGGSEPGRDGGPSIDF